MEFNNDKRMLQNIFKSVYPRLKEKKLPLKDHKAISSIMTCQTAEQGYNYLTCPEDHDGFKQYHSCRHRSCPVCADKARHDWIESQKERLLNCPHHHVIFTLPHEYISLWLYNRKWFTQHFFKACRDTLMTLLADERYLGVTPGILMTLHTWGRQMNMHPHIHCLVSSGGMTPSNKWKSVNNNYLLPIRVVKSLFRGKMQSYLRGAFARGELHLPANETSTDFFKNHARLYKKEWSIRIQEQYSHGQGVMLYLARYMKGGPINPKQICACTDKKISFRYKDHRDKKTKLLSLELTEFVRRILWHVPEVGIHTVRHFGLYASQCQQKRKRCHAILGAFKAGIKSGRETLQNVLQLYCETCGAVMQQAYTVYKHKSIKCIENSYIKASRFGGVQQGVRADALSVVGPDG